MDNPDHHARNRAKASASALYRYRWVLAMLTIAFLVGICLLFGSQLQAMAGRFFEILQNRKQLQDYILAFGWAAPIIFIGLQIAQVLLAPVPGEASGFIGGFLFGTIPGFVYSSIGLTVGSWLNFVIGRYLGHRFVRRVIPATHLRRFDRLAGRNSALFLFFLFLFPGFPKDYLCLFLGMGTLSLRLFLMMAAIGRMPGTFLLSLQGHFLFEGDYLLLTIAAVLCLLVGLLFYYYRKPLQRWLERWDPS